MGKTTDIISNHNLNVASLDALAKDVASRLKVSIEYGYEETYSLNKNQELDFCGDYKFIKLGAVVYEGSKCTYKLMDNYYGLKKSVSDLMAQGHKKSKLLKSNYIKEEYIEGESHLLFTLSIEDELELYIHETVIEYFDVERIDWRYFQKLFLYRIEQEDLDSLMVWREKLKSQVAKFGGDFMFVFCNEEESYKILDVLLKNSLLDSIPKINRIFKKVLVNIPNYLKSTDYLKKPHYEQQPISIEFFYKSEYACQNSIDFYPVKLDYPILFFDDFRDMKEIESFQPPFDFVYDGSFVLEQIQKLNQFQKSIKVQWKSMNLTKLEGYEHIYTGFLAGYIYYNAVNTTLKMSKNQQLYLVREPNNKYDGLAIAVYIDLKWDDETVRFKIGYIPKSENATIAELIDKKVPLRAFLIDIAEKELYKRNYDNVLNIAIFKKSN